MAFPKMQILAGFSKNAVRALASRFAKFAADNRAVSTVEYALITVAVVVIVGSGAVVMSGAFNELFTELETEIGEQSDAAREEGEDGGNNPDNQ